MKMKVVWGDLSLKLFNWLDNNKEKETLLVQFCKLLYSFEIEAIPHIVISIILGIFVPILWEISKVWSIVLLIIFVLENIFYCTCEKYHMRVFDERKFAANILADQSALTNSIAILIHDSNNWKNEIYKKTSDMVCAKIHEEFKTIYKCDVRVSVEYTFEKDFSGIKKICRKMAGRCSGDRVQAKNSTILSSRKEYYSYKIFKDNMVGIHYLEEKDINDTNPETKKWFKNPKHNVNVVQYIGLANSFNDIDVSFILQIDFLEHFDFGKDNTEDEVSKFINAYLKPYVNTISVAYLLGRNKHGVVGEV